MMMVIKLSDWRRDPLRYINTFAHDIILSEYWRNISQSKRVS